MEDFQMYLQPTRFIDSDSPDVIEFARSVTEGITSPVEQAVQLYYAVHDGIRYDPYHIDFAPAALKASTVLNRRSGFCIEKAIVLAAATRVLGIPSRLGFADVRNHLTTNRLTELLQTDVYIFHGYTQLFLENKWVKATPVFNLSLCERFGVKSLEFDGRTDSILQPFDRQGNRHMEYLHDRGQFADLPYDEMVSELTTRYPRLVLFGENRIRPEGDFETEALEESTRA